MQPELVERRQDLRNLWEFRSVFSPQRERIVASLQEALYQRSLVVICGPSGMQLKGLLMEINSDGLKREFVAISDGCTGEHSFPDTSLKPRPSFTRQGYFLGESDPLDSLQQRRLLDILATMDTHRNVGPFVVLHNLDSGALVHRFEPGFARLMTMNAVELPSANVERDELKRLLKAGAETVQVVDGAQYRGLSEGAVQSFVDRASRFSFPNNFEDIAALIDGLDRAAGLHEFDGDDVALVDQVLPTFAMLLAETARAHRGATSRAVMGAFAAGTGLPGIIGEGQPLDWDSIQRDVQFWVGTEVQRIARATGVPEESLINRTARQLQNWRRVAPDRIE